MNTDGLSEHQKRQVKLYAARILKIAKRRENVTLIARKAPCEREYSVEQCRMTQKPIPRCLKSLLSPVNR